MKKFLLSITLMLAAIVGVQAQRVSLDFTTNDSWGFPVGSSNKTAEAATFTSGDYSIELTGSSGNGYYFNSDGYLMLGKSGATLTLPAFDFNVSKIEVVGRTGASANTLENVYVGSTAVSTQCKGSAATNIFEIATEYQAAGTVYTIKIESNHNAQFTQINIYSADEPVAPSVSTPVASVAAGVYTAAQSVTFESEYANAENPTISYYYTTDGNEPTKESTLLEGALEVTESCTVKVIAVMTVGEEEYTSKAASYEYIISEAAKFVAVTATEQVVAGKVLLVANNLAAHGLSSNYGYLPVHNVTEVEGGIENAVYYGAFELEVAEGGWYIKDNNGKYLYLTGTYNSFNASEEIPAEGGVWTIAIAEDGTATITNVAMSKYVQYSTKYTSYGAYAEAQDGGVVPTLYVPYVEPTPEPGNMVKVYQITAKDTARGALYATAENTHLTHCGATYGNYHNRDIAVNAEDINQQFVLVEYEGVQYLYSLGAQKFAVKDGQYIKLTENPEGFVTVVDSDVEGYKNILFNGQNRLNFSGGYDHGCVANYETPDDGNRVLLTEVGKFDATELLASVEAYFVAKAEALAAARAAFDAAYADAAAILTEAALSVTENEVALQTTDNTAAYYLWSNYPEPNEGSINALVDNSTDNGEFFHTQWSNPVPQDTHYLELDLGEGNELAEFVFGYHTRVFNGANDFPDAIQVMGSNDGENYTEVANIASGLPQAGNKSWKSNIISSETAYRYFRFNVTAERIYWHMSEFDIFTSEVSVADKYAAVAKEVVALNKAYTDAANNADYDAETLTAAAEAIKACIETINAGVVEPEAPFEVVAVTPTEAVEELTTVTVEFSEEIEGTFDMMGMTQIYLGTKGNGCSFEVNGKVLTITPFNAINTPGEYKLVIPEGLITRKSNGEAVTMNGEYVFTVKEAEAPFEVVAVTPTEAVAELTTVTVEFSEEIEGTFDMMGMTQIYLGTKGNGCSFEVNGKVLTITPFNAINTPGEYKLVIPEGLITRKSNGEAVTMNGEYVFTVKEAEAPFEVVAVTPTEAVAELTTVTVEFSEEIEGTFDMMGMTQIYLGTKDRGCSFEVNGKVLTITPFNAINTPGEYKLVIPEGLITRKSNGEAVTMNGEYVFTVKEAVVEPETFTVTAALFPTVEGDVTEIKGIRVEAGQGPALAELPTGWTLTNEAGDEFEMNIQWLYDYETILIMVNPAITEAGTYTLTIPAGSLKTDDGKECEAATFSWTVVGPVDPYMPYNNGTRTNTGRVIRGITLTGASGENSYALTADEQTQDYTDATAVAVFKVEAGEELTITFDKAGEWIHQFVFIDFDGDGFTASIAEGSEWAPAEDLVAYSFYNNDSSDDNYGWNSVGTSITGNDRSTPAVPAFKAPETIGKYRMRVKQDWCNIDPAGDADGKFGDFKANGGQIIDVILEVVEATTGIENVEAETINAIYDITGRKIEKITEGGIYIVNGKKVLVK